MQDRSKSRKQRRMCNGPWAGYPFSAAEKLQMNFRMLNFNSDMQASGRYVFKGRRIGKALFPILLAPSVIFKWHEY